MIPLAHIAAEDAVKASGMNWTFVRPSFFMQNLRGLPGQAKETGKVSMPMGNGTVTLTDCADAGAFMARVLTTDPQQHYGQCYDITGPDLVLTFNDVAKIVGEVIGQDVDYDDCDADAFQEAIRPFHRNDWHSDAVAYLFAEIANGKTPGIKTNTFQEMMGKPGTSFKEFLQKIA